MMWDVKAPFSGGKCEYKWLILNRVLIGVTLS